MAGHPRKLWAGKACLSDAVFRAVCNTGKLSYTNFHEQIDNEKTATEFSKTNERISHQFRGAASVSIHHRSRAVFAGFRSFFESLVKNGITVEFSFLWTVAMFFLFDSFQKPNWENTPSF